MQIDCQLSAELGETGIRDAAGKMAVSQHPRHAQVLDGDGVELGRQLRGQLVQRIGSDIADALMQLCQLGFRLGAVAAAFLLATETTGKPHKPLMGRAVRLQRRDDFAGAECCEFLDTKIDTDGPAMQRAAQAIGRIHEDGDIPAVGHPADGGGQRPADEAQFLAHPDDTAARQLDRLANTLDGMALAVLGSVVGTEGVVHPLLLEAWIAGLAALLDATEEVLESDADILDGILRGNLGDLTHPRKVLGLDGVQALPESSFVRLATGFIFRLPLGQGPIECEAGDTTRPAEVFFLHGGRVELDLMDAMHLRRPSSWRQSGRGSSCCGFHRGVR